MLHFSEIKSLTKDFRDIRKKRRKTAIPDESPTRESPEILDFRDPFFSETKQARRRVPAGLFPSRWKGLAEGGDTARETRKFPRGGIFVKDSGRDAAAELGLDLLQGSDRLLLVAGLDRRFDLLHEGADAADAGAVDLRAALVAADAFLCLRRVRHRIAS
jgi:hypothetical protein